VDSKARQDEDGYRCECGRWQDLPDWYPERQHILYTLICDCARVYTVVGGWRSCGTNRTGRGRHRNDSRRSGPWKASGRRPGMSMRPRAGVETAHPCLGTALRSLVMYP
jgi:hypothetical protein